MLEAVGALPLRMKSEQRVEKVGNRETAVFPALQVDDQSVEVGGIVRETRPQRGNCGDAPVDARRRDRQRPLAVGLDVDRAILSLQFAKLGDRVLQVAPGGWQVSRCRRRFARRRRTGPRHDVRPQRHVVVVRDRVVAEQVGIGEHHDPATVCADGDGKRRAGGVGVR